MLGLNGGLMGVRKVPTTGTATGVWAQNEQSVAKRAGIWPATPATDPNFANVQLLVRGEGANGGTTFTDSSSFDKPLVTTGDATTSTTNFRFGTSSILFGGSGNVQMTAASQDPWISMGTGLYTAEWWVYIGSSGISGSFFRNGSAQLTYNSNTIRLYSIDYGSLFLNTGQSLTPAVWTHLAVVQTASTTVVYVNGVGYDVGYKVGTTTLSPINIGSNGFTGYIDELRVTKDVARYTANFTPPTAPFPDS